MLIFSSKYVVSSIFICLIASILGFSSMIQFSTIPATNVALDQKKVIILDAGHGGEDCGTIGVNGIYEKDINLRMAFILQEYFELAGYKVFLTREEDKLLYREEENIYGQRKIYDLKNRLLFAEKIDNAIFISLHMNSYPIEKYCGLQVWFQSNSEISYSIATSIQEHVAKTIQPDNTRKIKAADKNIYLLDRLKHPAVLIECGFLSNAEECEKLSEDNYQKELSFVIFCAILNSIER